MGLKIYSDEETMAAEAILDLAEALMVPKEEIIEALEEQGVLCADKVTEIERGMQLLGAE